MPPLISLNDLFSELRNGERAACKYRVLSRDYQGKRVNPPYRSSN